MPDFVCSNNSFLVHLSLLVRGDESPKLSARDKAHTLGVIGWLLTAQPTAGAPWGRRINDTERQRRVK